MNNAQNSIGLKYYFQVPDEKAFFQALEINKYHTQKSSYFTTYFDIAELSAKNLEAYKITSKLPGNSLSLSGIDYLSYSSHNLWGTQASRMISTTTEFGWVFAANPDEEKIEKLVVKETYRENVSSIRDASTASCFYHYPAIDLSYVSLLSTTATDPCSIKCLTVKPYTPETCPALSGKILWP
jgi:hypothetical protein